MLILKAFKKITNVRPFIRISSTTILYLLVPGLSKNLLLSLNCTSVDDQSVSSLSYALGCNESRFIVLKYTLILPCFFVWCVIIPFKSDKLQRRKTSSFLLSEYDERFGMHDKAGIYFLCGSRFHLGIITEKLINQGSAHLIK